MLSDKDKLRIFNHIRIAFRQSETMQETKRLAIHPILKGKRGGNRFQCKGCDGDFKANEIQIDHIKPVVPIGFKKLDMIIGEYTDRTFCNQFNLQALCKECHKIKNSKERELRSNSNA